MCNRARGKPCPTKDISSSQRPAHTRGGAAPARAASLDQLFGAAELICASAVRFGHGLRREHGSRALRDPVREQLEDRVRERRQVVRLARRDDIAVDHYFTSGSPRVPTTPRLRCLLDVELHSVCATSARVVATAPIGSSRATAARWPDPVSRESRRQRLLAIEYTIAARSRSLLGEIAVRTIDLVEACQPPVDLVLDLRSESRHRDSLHDQPYEAVDRRELILQAVDREHA